jgi:hypothetical protein
MFAKIKSLFDNFVNAMATEDVAVSTALFVEFPATL